MARFARMRGRPTLWLPGTDHAGIATQVMLSCIYTHALSKQTHTCMLSAPAGTHAGTSSLMSQETSAEQDVGHARSESRCRHLDMRQAACMCSDVHHLALHSWWWRSFWQRRAPPERSWAARRSQSAFGSGRSVHKCRHLSYARQPYMWRTMVSQWCHHVLCSGTVSRYTLPLQCHEVAAQLWVVFGEASVGMSMARHLV
jgi:hypothetical protein